jgi:hypothetical protein
MSYILCLAIYGQKEDYNWIIGANILNTIEFTEVGFSIDTFQPNPYVRLHKTNTSISDSFGDLVLFSGGAAVYNFQGNILTNGDSINYGYVWETWAATSGAYGAINGVIFLKSISKNYGFILFQMKGDTFQNVNNNSGLGGNILYSTIKIDDNEEYYIEKKMLH